MTQDERLILSNHNGASLNAQVLFYILANFTKLMGYQVWAFLSSKQNILRCKQSIRRGSTELHVFCNPYETMEKIHFRCVHFGLPTLMFLTAGCVPSQGQEWIVTLHYFLNSCFKCFTAPSQEEWKPCPLPLVGGFDFTSFTPDNLQVQTNELPKCRSFVGWD